MHIAKNMEPYKMTSNKLKNNQQGFVLSLDLHMSLIIITIILGISANTLSYETQKISSTAHTYAIEHQTIETTEHIGYKDVVVDTDYCRTQRTLANHSQDIP